SVGSGVGVRQKSGTLNTGIALTLPVILYWNAASIGICGTELEHLWNFHTAGWLYVCIDLTRGTSWHQCEDLRIAEGISVKAYIVRSMQAYGTSQAYG